MRRTPVLAAVLVAGSLWAGLPARSSAEDAVTLSERQERVRTTDRRLRRLLDEGARASPTFRALIDRLNASDVVVYVECAGTHGLPRVEGRLLFVATAGGFRYVVLQVAWLAPRHRQLAILAHELQHAVEIAETPSIVDASSLAREYVRFGRVSRRPDSGSVAFDTLAAVQAGAQVLRELNGGG
jgi:hypothetical protein